MACVARLAVSVNEPAAAALASLAVRLRLALEHEPNSVTARVGNELTVQAARRPEAQ